MSGDNGLIASGEVVYFSRCYPTTEGGGGCRRTAQLADVLKDTGFRFVSVRDYYSGKYKGVPDFQEYLKSGDIPQWYMSKWRPGRRDDVAFMYYVSWLWGNEIAKSGSLKLALVDDPIYFFPLVRQLALRGVPVVALSQNIETLSRSQLIEEYQRELLGYELAVLSLCALVVTISREETVLLKNLGVDTLFLPYYPVKDIRERMLSIREKRKTTRKEDFLLIGTAHNPPTMKGMEEIIRQWSSVHNTYGGARLYVAGYGSEPLKDLCDGKDVVFKGTLSDGELDRILMHIKACIVYQEDGSGALTKISEFLLADIPVIANSHAARTYYDVPGVIEFARINDLGTALNTVYSKEMKAQAPVPPDASSLTERINDLLGPEGAAKAASIKEAAEAMPLAGMPSACLAASASQAMLRKVAQVELEAVEAHRDALLNSLSWRVTVPLRYIAKFFMKNNGNR
jgi:glycosyltransferase involved in cell wall biosynthesis